MNVAQHKIINLLKIFFAHQFLLVFVYLMCGPRQLFLFQCGPETPKGWTLHSKPNLQDSFVPVSSTAFTTELLLNFILSQNFPEVCMVFPARFSALQDSGYFLHVFVSSVAPREGELTFKCLLYARPCNSAFLFITSHLFLTANLQR